MTFKDLEGNSYEIDKLVDFIDKDYSYEVYVGSDSQVHRDIKKVVYVSCVVLYKKGKGAKIFVNKEQQPMANSLKQRLSNEAWRSLEVSFQLSKLLPPDVQIIIHLDVNPSRKFKSGEYYQDLAAMITGQGFKCVVKPDAFAAQSVADRFSK